MKTILVVDDEPDIRESVKMVLEKKGYRIITAVDGDDCLHRLHEETPDLILLDIMMPGIPVKEVIQKIEGIKIAFLSVVRTSEAERQDLLQQKNIVAFIRKPFSTDELLKIVKKTLGE